MNFSNLVTELSEIQAQENEYLFASTSLIDNAGQGLFTTIPLYRAEILAEFTGRVLTSEQTALLAYKGKDMYFMELPDGGTLDCMDSDCFAKYANDAQGLIPSVYKNNTIILQDEKGRICLVASRNIKAGEEIFCSYGKKYWKNIQKRNAEKHA